jgi:hypothetical protein
MRCVLVLTVAAAVTTPYVMRCDASGFQVLSAGPDRTLGTADDLETHR